ncbi:family 20 glycosylhydrolase [Odoribacter lunatus]|uniref:glycoside hydrolase family 20 protein n=1 Tax=Odoribacter lunatus TaxID=2941335 RepID=UPI0020407FB8|nr:family 20 glycosylhydrolase [Odoribacter lunatus]
MYCQNFLIGIVLIFSFSFVACQSERVPQELNVIPVPEKVEFGKGVCRLNQYTRIFSQGGCSGDFFITHIDSVTNSLASYRFGEQEKEGSYIRFSLDSLAKMEKEGYFLSISPDGVEIKASTNTGLFYGLQTFLQILEDNRFYKANKREWILPVVQISDKPAFSYRGLHLDVARHFFPVEFVKKYLDLMAMYKFNMFHWHLTDAGGWRFEVKRYPELTRYGAWRTQEDWIEWWNKGDRTFMKEEDEGAYGGYYTQEEIKDIVAYAAERHIQVIPEIEMPGHSEEVLAVYPKLKCPNSAKSGEFCIGNEASFKFIENVLAEVMELFPSEYIHIGGDEASKSAWKKCPLCQRRMKTEHLKNEKELQSYLIKRVEKFLYSKGRKIIGWDEILEGGLAPRATVMSWRGEQGGVEAARSGHDVIMTPGTYCYFDSYQAEPETQPYAIGGFLPYLKVYSYHPVPAELTAKEASHVLGAQANLWTEYIPTPEHLEYMAFPRTLALAEVVWSPKEKKDDEDFKRRVQAHITNLRKKGVNAFTLSNRVDMEMSVDTSRKQIWITFDTEKYKPEIRYTLDGSIPDMNSSVYTGAFGVDSATVKAALFTDGKRCDVISTGRFDYHKAIGKKVSYANKYSGSYPAAGDATLTDGYRGGLTYGDGRWQGFLKNLDVIIDLDSVQTLHSVGIRFMQLTGPGVYMPKYVQVSVSEDGKNFIEVGQVNNDIPSDKPDLFFKEFVTKFSAQGRYVRIFARKQAGFMFTDEIIVY